MEIKESSELQRYLDSDGKLKIWPSKKNLKRTVLEYIASKFDFDRHYTEKEVNAVISENHTFNDYFLVRRELIEHKLLDRTMDCSSYWRVKEDTQDK